MSYEKVKSIKFDKENKTVWATSACNNCRPLRYTTWEIVGYGRIWQEQGYDAMIKELLDDVVGGNLQFHSGKYREFRNYTWLERVKEKYPELSWDWIKEETARRTTAPDYFAWQKLNPDKRWQEYEATPDFLERKRIMDIVEKERKEKIYECFKDFESKDTVKADYTFKDMLEHLAVKKTILWDGIKKRVFYRNDTDCLYEYIKGSRSRGIAFAYGVAKQFEYYKGRIKLV